MGLGWGDCGGEEDGGEISRDADCGCGGEVDVGMPAAVWVAVRGDADEAGGHVEFRYAPNVGCGGDSSMKRILDVVAFVAVSLAVGYLAIMCVV